MWIKIPDDKVDAVRALLTDNGARPAPGLYDPPSDFARTFIDAARRLYGSNELEFDDDAVVSLGEDAGVFVMGWRWITDEEAGVSR
jgi:hypothetical protein